MALIDKLTDIADAIREKTGTSDKLTLDAMPTAISNIETGGGGEDIFTTEDLTFTGNLAYFNYYDNTKSLLDKARDNDFLKFQNVTNLNQAFAGSKFDFNGIEIHLAGDKAGSSSNGLGRIFSDYAGTKLPKLTGKWGKCIGMNQNFLGGMQYIKDFDGVFDNVDWSYFDANYTTDSYNCVRDICNSNSRMRKGIPSHILKHWDSTNTWGNIAYYPYTYCYALDEISDFPVFDNTYYRVYMTLSGCYRLKKLTFETNADGSPRVVTNWTFNSVIDTTYCGYGSSVSYVDNPKAIRTDADYALYKDDPDACPTYDRYSRYNHDSAVETINSLPDASAVTGYTHTIKFKGAAGSSTDGGAINTLTEAEIAVAAAKGWTVTLS